MTFSGLISGTIQHHGKYGVRPGKVTRVIQHHWASTTLAGKNALESPNTKKSVTYLILNDGVILGQVPEEFRPWTSGGPAADNPSITIEIQNETGAPEWKISDAALSSLMRLLADIATRHAFGDLNTTNYKGHRDFAATACPGPYLYPRLQSVRDGANAIRHGATPVANPVTPVSPPAQDPAVSALVKAEQNFLNVARGEHLEVDGLKGPATRAAYKRYQEFLRAYGYTEDLDGLWGPGTQAAHAVYYAEWSSPHKPATKPNCEALQSAVRTGVDNSWGPDTDKHFDALREASVWGGHDFPWGVAYTQGVVGTKQDNSWGPNSVRAHDATVKAVQLALRAMGFNPGDIDGDWGSATEAAYQSARRACRI